MKELIQALLADLKESIASAKFDEEGDKEVATSSLETLETQLEEAKDDEDLRKVRAGIAELKFDLPAGEGSKEKTANLIGEVYALFQKLQGAELGTAEAGIRESFERLMLAKQDINWVLRYLKELMMMIDLNDSDLNDDAAPGLASKDDEAAKSGEAFRSVGEQKYPAEAYLYTPDVNKPSTWKYRIWEDPESKVTIARLNRIAVAFSPISEPDVPAEELEGLRDSLVDKYIEAGATFDEVPVPIALDAQATQDKIDNRDALEAVAQGEKPKKTENGKKFPAQAFLFVPDPQKPSTWKLRIWETPEKKVTVAQLGKAAAALSPGGFRGNKVQLPSGEAGKIKSKLVALYKQQDVAKEDIPSHLFNGNGSSEKSKASEVTTMDFLKWQKIQKVLEQIEKLGDDEKALATELTELSEAESLNDEQKARLDEVLEALSQVKLPETDDDAEEDTNDNDAATEDTDDAEAGDDAETDSDDDAEDAEAGDDNEVASLKARVAKLEAEKLATARIEDLKKKGLHIVFAGDDKARKREIERLMKMSEAEYEDHVSLLEAAVNAGVKKAEAAAKKEDEDDTGETEKPVVSTASQEDWEESFACLDSLFDDGDEDEEDSDK